MSFRPEAAVIAAFQIGIISYAYHATPPPSSQCCQTGAHPWGAHALSRTSAGALARICRRVSQTTTHLNPFLPNESAFQYWRSNVPEVEFFLGRAGLTVLIASVTLVASTGAKAADKTPMKRLEKSEFGKLPDGSTAHLYVVETRGITYPKWGGFCLETQHHPRFAEQAEFHNLRQQLVPHTPPFRALLTFRINILENGARVPGRFPELVCRATVRRVFVSSLATTWLINRLSA